jgi:hypothetical protein
MKQPGQCCGGPALAGEVVAETVTAGAGAGIRGGADTEGPRYAGSDFAAANLGEVEGQAEFRRAGPAVAVGGVDPGADLRHALIGARPHL